MIDILEIFLFNFLFDEMKEIFSPIFVLLELFCKELREIFLSDFRSEEV
jgi:hypothetical protein